MKYFALGIAAAIVIVILSFVLSTTNTAIDSFVPPASRTATVVNDNEFTWYQPADKTFTAVRFDSHDLSVEFTSENAQSLKEQTLSGDWDLAFNGGYFAGSLIEALPIGGLSVKGNKLTEPVNDSQNQVTQIVVFDHEELKLSIVPQKNFSQSAYDSERYTYFQTGPLMLKNSEIQTDEINNSINGADKYLRAVLGYTDKGEIVFAASRVTISLPDFAQKLMDTELINNRTLTLVNLDGGSSTAIFSPELEQFNFGENKRLPYVIGVIKNE